MKKYKIGFMDADGIVEVGYNVLGRLRSVNVSDDYKYSIEQTVGHIPETKTEFLAKKWKPNVVLMESDYRVEFEDFWKVYDKKTNRIRAEKIWSRLSETDKIRAVDGVEIYKKYLRRNDWRNQKDPDTWLRNRCWEDGIN